MQGESNVQILHVANFDKPVEFYNLDIIISCGFRIKSKINVIFVFANQQVNIRL